MMTLFLALGAAATHSTAAGADDFQTRVAMTEKSAATFYVPAEISGFGSAELMVDTGSGYMTINEETLAVLRQSGQIRYVKQLHGVLADGTELVVPVYAISALSIGGKCWLHDVEAAVFPGDARQILGLSALRKASPFIFSVDPPLLALSRCTGSSVAASGLAGVNATHLVD
jgi:predicted aspartyl protease